MKKNTKDSLWVGACTGLMLAGLCFLGIYITHCFGEMPLGRFQLAFTWPLFFCCFSVGVYFFREYRNEGAVSVREAFSICLVATFTASLCFGLSVYTFFELNPEVFDKHQQMLFEFYNRSAKELGKELGAAETATLHQRLTATTCADIAQHESFKFLGIGVVFTLIVGLVFKKRKVIQVEA